MRQVVPRALLVLAVVGLTLGVGDRDQAAPSTVPGLDVLVAVDRTTSMSALDGPSGSRMTAVREDLAQLGELLPTASFAVVTFGRSARTALPFTSDRTAYQDAVAALQVEPPVVGTGSSVSRAVPLLVSRLTGAAVRDDDRIPVVVLLSDGERTSPETQASFARVGDRSEAGVVLGYGTEAGAVMPLARVDPDEKPPTPQTVGATVTVVETGEPAISRLDPGNLARIADELGTPYVHRDGRTGMATVAETIQSAAYDDLKPGEPERERRWVWALAVLVLILPELRRGWRQYLEMRRETR